MEDCPTLGLKVLVGHGIHAVAPMPAYVPIGQTVQVLEPVLVV